MSGSRRGLVAPQNTFLDKIIRRCNGQYFGFCLSKIRLIVVRLSLYNSAYCLVYSFVLANACIVDYPIVYCNEGFSRLTGYSRVEIMQASGSCTLFFGDQTTIEMRERLLKALSTQTSDRMEILFYKKNKTPLWLMVCIAPVQNEREEVVLFLLAFRDITALKTPFEDEETSKGLSKFARLARSVTRNRSVLQQVPSTQSSTVTPSLMHFIRNQRSNAANMTNKSFTLNSCLGSMTNLNTTSGKRSQDSNKSDPEKVALTTASWFDLVPTYKQESPKTPPHIILHYVAFKTTWDWLILFLTGYTAVMVPFNAAFKSKTMDDVSFLVIDSIVDVIFFIDIVLNFHTTFVGPNGEVISDATIIRINYLKGWFIVDLLSCLPYDVFNAFQPEATQSTISSLFGALKVVRLLRIGRVTRKLDQYLEYMAASLLLMISGFVLLAHWLACVWYSVGQADLKNGIYYGWIPRLLNDIDQTKSIPSNWTGGNPPLPRTMTYVTSLYFTLSLITSIGFGNVSATTFGEKLVAAVFMLIGAFGYATIFGNVTTIFQGMYATRSRYHDMMSSVKDFIKTHSVPKDLAERVIDYVTSTWAITKGIDTAKVLNYCPKDMKADLCIHLNRMVFNEHPAFRLASDGCLRALAVNFNTIHTAPGDLIFHQGESIDQLCFVVSGSLEVIQDDEIVAFLGCGDVFGEPFWKDPNRMSHSAATVRALTYCDLHCIKKDCLLQVLNFYSAFANSFARNLVLTYDLKTRLIFRKLADVKREYELAEHRKHDNALSNLRPDHPVRRMIHRFRKIGSHNPYVCDSPIGSQCDNDFGHSNGKSVSSNELEISQQQQQLLIPQKNQNKTETETDVKSGDKVSHIGLNEIAFKWGKRMETKLQQSTSTKPVQNEIDHLDDKSQSKTLPKSSNQVPNITKDKLATTKLQSKIVEKDTIQKRFENLELSNGAILNSLNRIQSNVNKEFVSIAKQMNTMDSRLTVLLNALEKLQSFMKQWNPNIGSIQSVSPHCSTGPYSIVSNKTNSKLQRSAGSSNKIHPLRVPVRQEEKQSEFVHLDKNQNDFKDNEIKSLNDPYFNRNSIKQTISQFYKQYSEDTDSQTEHLSTGSDTSSKSYSSYQVFDELQCKWTEVQPNVPLRTNALTDYSVNSNFYNVNISHYQAPLTYQTTDYRSNAQLSVNASMYHPLLNTNPFLTPSTSTLVTRDNNNNNNDNNNNNNSNNNNLQALTLQSPVICSVFTTTLPNMSTIYSTTQSRYALLAKSKPSETTSNLTSSNIPLSTNTLITLTSSHNRPLLNQSHTIALQTTSVRFDKTSETNKNDKRL